MDLSERHALSLLAQRRSRRDAERFCHSDQIGHRSRAHFLHQVTAMHLHGDLAKLEFGCDLLAHQPARDESHNFALARGQQLEMRLQLGDHMLMLAALLITLDRSCDGIQKILVAKRLSKEVDGASFHGPHRHGNVAMPRDEHDGSPDVRLRQLGLEIETAQSWKANIEYQAARHVRALATQELL